MSSLSQPGARLDMVLGPSRAGNLGTCGTSQFSSSTPSRMARLGRSWRACAALLLLGCYTPGRMSCSRRVSGGVRRKVGERRRGRDSQAHGLGQTRSWVCCLRQNGNDATRGCLYLPQQLRPPLAWHLRRTKSSGTRIRRTKSSRGTRRRRTTLQFPTSCGFGLSSWDTGQTRPA